MNCKILCWVIRIDSHHIIPKYEQYSTIGALTDGIQSGSVAAMAMVKAAAIGTSTTDTKHTHTQSIQLHWELQICKCNVHAFFSTIDGIRYDGFFPSVSLLWNSYSITVAMHYMLQNGKFRSKEICCHRFAPYK